MRKLIAGERRNSYPEGSFPKLDGHSRTIEAKVNVPEGGAQGVVVTQRGQFSGWGLVFLRGIPTFLNRANNWDETLFRLAPAPLLAGDSIVSAEFTADGPEPGRGGRYVMKIDGRQVAEERSIRHQPSVSQLKTLRSDTTQELL